MSACAPSSAPPAAAPTATARLTVPRFAADDPRVATAGFVSQTTRVSRDVGETTYTLMIFAVGDVLTLGAMIRGSFDGIAEWSVADRRFSVPLRRSARGTDGVRVTGEPLVGRHGGFDDFDWVNVEVPLDEWLPDGTPVRLVFRSDASTVALPEDGGSFAAATVAR